MTAGSGVFTGRDEGVFITTATNTIGPWTPVTRVFHEKLVAAIGGHWRNYKMVSALVAVSLKTDRYRCDGQLNSSPTPF
jgi:hypothetical protein